MKKYLFLIILSLFLLAAVRVSPALGYSQTSPHWSHINILDFARGVYYLPEPYQTQAYDWVAAHLDISENKSAALKSRNSNIKTFTYDLDLSSCLHVGCGYHSALLPDEAGTSEAFFLHFSEDTTVDYYHFGTFLETKTITGCPSPGPMTKSCRVLTFIWDDYRYIYNPKNSSFVSWMSARLNSAAAANGDDGIFLDEHGNTFQFGEGNIVKSGGGIREYSGLKEPSTALNTAYNVDICSALSAYYTYLKDRGKFLFINTAGYSNSPNSLARGKAAHGIHVETMHRPDLEAYTFEGFQNTVSEILSVGGIVDTRSSTEYWGPAAYTAGNYASSRNRYLMWRLAAYYIIKEPVGSSGMVLFNPTFSIHFYGPNYLDFIDEWQTAYETDVGLPENAAYVIKTGNNNPTYCNGAVYKIWAREYTKALTVVRPTDSWSCTDYGDTTGITVDLPAGHIWHFLKEDGTTGPPITYIAVRNGEAVILLKADSSDTTPPVAPTGLVVI